MDPEFLHAVRENLLSLGYENLSDSLVEEFARRLQEDEGVMLSPAPGFKKMSQLPRRPKAAEQPKRPSGESESDEDAAEPEDDPAFRPQSIASPPRNSAAKSDRNEDEIAQWSKRLKDVESKAENLDSQIRECRSAIIDPQTGENEYQDVPLYYGTSERGLDPYPAVSRKISGGGGFIRPLPIRASRRAAANGGKGRRLLYEQRFPDYVPPPERRRDALRWKIRQQIEYSDPRYRQ